MVLRTMYVSNDLGYENVRKHRIIFIFFIVSFYSIDKKTKGNSQHTTGALRATSRTRRLRHVIALTDVIRKTRLFRRVITGSPPPARVCRRNGGFLSRFSKEIPSRWRHFPLLSHTPSRRYVKHEWISECIYMYVFTRVCVWAILSFFMFSRSNSRFDDSSSSRRAPTFSARVLKILIVRFRSVP